MELNLEEITAKVSKIALQAGAFLRNERQAFDRSKVEKKQAHDYVSYVDKESEIFIVNELKKLLPEAGFIAEEGTASLTTEPYCWVVDPLDGTTNFIHDNAPYCVSIALRDSKELLIGVVYEVCRKELYTTFLGAPSLLNGKEIRVSKVDQLDDAFIAMGLPYNVEKYKPMAMHLIKELYGNVSGTRLQGAAAAELCYVAAGRFEARIEAFLGPWDIAAGALILKNAGGMISDFSGGEAYVSGTEVLATNGRLHKLLLGIIGKV
ncbi:MAG: inositol monophosphatase family protein [Phocaeicola sp.]